MDGTRIMDEQAATAGRSSPVSVRRVSVLVNGRKCEVEGDEVNFAQLAGLAFPKVAPAAVRTFTVAFTRGPAARPEGFVTPGERVHVIEDQRFVVVVADQS